MATKSKQPGTNTVTGCSFTAEAGKPQPAETAQAVTALASALAAQAKAVSDLSLCLRGTAPGSMGTGLHLSN